MTVKLSGFADEISPDLTIQLDVLESLGIKHLELRGVWEKNISDFNDDDVATVRDGLEKRGFKVSAIGSPIGKICIKDDFESHIEKFQRVLDIAEEFDAPYIRLFSFFIPKGENAESYRQEVMDRMTVLCRMASGRKTRLLHENEKEIYGDTGDRCLDLHTFMESQGFDMRAIFDFANFIQSGQNPLKDCYPKLKSYIEYVHVKDARIDGTVVPAGQGDGSVEEILRDLSESGYDGFLSIEPHLAWSSSFSGFSGPELFEKAAQSLKTMLVRLNIPFE